MVLQIPVTAPPPTLAFCGSDSTYSVWFEQLATRNSVFSLNARVLFLKHDCLNK